MTERKKRLWLGITCALALVMALSVVSFGGVSAKAEAAVANPPYLQLVTQSETESKFTVPNSLGELAEKSNVTATLTVSATDTVHTAGGGTLSNEPLVIFRKSAAYSVWFKVDSDGALKVYYGADTANGTELSLTGNDNAIAQPHAAGSGKIWSVKAVSTATEVEFFVYGISQGTVTLPTEDSASQEQTYDAAFDIDCAGGFFGAFHGLSCKIGDAEKVTLSKTSEITDFVVIDTSMINSNVQKISNPVNDFLPYDAATDTYTIANDKTSATKHGILCNGFLQTGLRSTELVNVVSYTVTVTGTPSAVDKVPGVTFWQDLEDPKKKYDVRAYDNSNVRVIKGNAEEAYGTIEYTALDTANSINTYSVTIVTRQENHDSESPEFFADITVVSNGTYTKQTVELPMGRPQCELFSVGTEAKFSDVRFYTVSTEKLGNKDVNFVTTFAVTTHPTHVLGATELSDGLFTATYFDGTTKTFTLDSPEIYYTSESFDSTCEVAQSGIKTYLDDGITLILRNSTSVVEGDVMALHTPVNTVNVASAADITLSAIPANSNTPAEHENTYIGATAYGWDKAFLTDGTFDKGWTTDPYEGAAEDTPVTVTLDLKKSYKLSQVTLFPASGSKLFPKDYTVSVSSDGTNWNDVASATDIAGAPTSAQDHACNGVEARYIKIHITKRNSTVNANTGGTEILAQIGEIGIFASTDDVIVNVSLNKNALELAKGETDRIVAKADTVGAELTWESSDTAVATVSDGVITAVAAGNTTVSVKHNGEVKGTVNVTVVESKKTFDENILLTVFWPPTLRYMGSNDALWDEQYGYMRDAGIDYINNVTTGDLTAKETNLKMAQYAYKYGMRVSVADTRFGTPLLGMKESEIYDMISEYRNVPGVGGYYILDEPINPNAYAQVYEWIKKADPSGYAHMNFLPYGAYSDAAQYEAQMNDWLAVNAGCGYEQDYLMYDLYPYPDNGTSMSRTSFYTNMASAWRVGLANNVKTATYLQSVRIPGKYRSPSVAEIRYEAMVALAYGYKQLSYFTWFTPFGTNQFNETFEEGVILGDGTRNPKTYNGIVQLNNEIHTLGSTLINLDAKEVYLNGQTWGQQAIPADFFAQPIDKTNFTVSYLRNKDTGRGYMMVVNNDYESDATVNLKLSSEISSLAAFNATNGGKTNVSITGGMISVTLAAGDGKLFELPEGFDPESPRVVAKGENLARKARIIADSSTGADNHYINKLNDGVLFSDASRNSNGYKSVKAAAVITLDLGVVTDFNRIDLYPYGDSIFSYGDGLPRNFTVETSSDGKTFVAAKSITDFIARAPQSITFDSVNARYIRISVSDSYDAYVALAEIEVYNDDGTLPKPELPFPEDDTVITYTPGANLALNKRVRVSSKPAAPQYKEWGWFPDFVNDGKTGSGGWTSDIGANFDPSATEWVIIDFGDTFAVNKIKVYCGGGAFPENFVLELSEDMSDWTTARSVTGDPGTEGWREYELDEPINARFIRMFGTKLRMGGQTADGYLMQVGEIEAYGTPVVDKTKANEFIASLDALAELLAGENTAAIDALKAGMANANITQSGLNSLLKAAAAELEEVRNPDTTAAQAILARVEAIAKQLETENTDKLDAAVTALEDALENGTAKNKLDGLTEAVKTEFEKLLASDKTAAEAALARVTQNANAIAGKDTTALDAATKALKAALDGDVTQSELDRLTKAVNDELDRLTAAEEGGCGCSGTVGVISTSYAFAVLVLVAAAVLFARKRRTSSK